MHDQAVLVRYGLISEVSRFAPPVLPVERGQTVVVQTHRGLEVGIVLEAIAARTNGHAANNGHSHDQDDDGRASTTEKIVRPITADDEVLLDELRNAAQQEFGVWMDRIREWKLELELIDLEWTLDRKKLILYVLSGRGPDCTKLALHAAAAGISNIEVQPINEEGLVKPLAPSGGGGCGTGGCGCHT